MVFSFTLFHQDYLLVVTEETEDLLIKVKVIRRQAQVLENHIFKIHATKRLDKSQENLFKMNSLLPNPKLAQYDHEIITFTEEDLKKEIYRIKK